MISVKPGCNLTYVFQVLDCIESTSQIADVYRFRILLSHNLIPKTPDCEHAIHVRLVILAIKRIGRVRLLRRNTTELVIKMAAVFAIAHAERAGRWPPIRKESVNRIVLIDFAIDRRHLLSEVSTEHARRKQPR